MPRDEHQGQEREQKSWAEWKAELHEAIEELDKACAHARQVIYRLRPLVRPRGQRRSASGAEEEQAGPPASLDQRRQGSRDE